MPRLHLLIAGLLLHHFLFAQEKIFQEPGPRGPLTRAVDMVRLGDGTFLCLLTEQNVTYQPFLTATFLLHVSQQGDSLERLNIGNPVSHVMYTSFLVRNDSVLIQGVTAPDSVVPHYSRKGAYITTFYIHTAPLYLVQLSFAKIETAFSVYTQHFKALSWYYYREVGYTAEVCRFDSDTGTGYKIRHPGNVTIRQLIETHDGGVLALGDVWHPGAGDDNDLYMLRLDKNLQPLWEQTYGLTKGTSPPASVRPNSARPTFFITKKVVNGDTITEVENRMVADTITGHTQDLFKAACLSDDNCFFLLGTVYGVNRGETCYLAKYNMNGELLWHKFNSDTVQDSVYYYSRGICVLPMKNGGCIVAGCRNAGNDPVHSEAFAWTFDRSGKLKSGSSAAMPNKWITVAKVIRAGKNYYLFGDQMDALRNPLVVPFMCRLNKKGKFVPFRK